MYDRVSVNIAVAALVAGLSFWGIGGNARSVFGQHCGGCGGAGCAHGRAVAAGAEHAGHEHSGHAASAGEDHSGHRGAASAPSAQPGPHGGQITPVEGGAFEVVYWPKEIRVYLYDAEGRPLSAERVAGEVALQVRGVERVFRYPLKYVASPAGSGQHDHLAVAVDVSQVRDGDMKASFQFTRLPFAQPEARFVQTFALSRLAVILAKLEAADQAGIDRQKVCPVTGEELGSMGEPIKLLVAGQPLYVCCRGCVRKVQQNPDVYLAKARQPGGQR